MTRVPVISSMKKRLFEANANSCCVCKSTGIGLNVHHIDGNNRNTVEENLAVLCVNEHDAHHRPEKYSNLNHQGLSPENFLEYKKEWESFVSECKKDEPQVLATINVFGTYENLVGMKIIFQWLNGKIVFERNYQRLDGDLNYWTDKAIGEVLRFGKNIKIALIDKPLEIEFCPHHKNALSRTLDEPIARKISKNDWKEKSIGTVYLNPFQPSLAISIFYDNETVYVVSIHRCNDKIQISDYRGTKCIIPKASGVRRQVKSHIMKLLKKWEVSMIFYGTGNPEKPILRRNCALPKCWEYENI